ncbi:aminotransferase class I/II-fold pyridoxal phosphate-dependent enzyme [Acidobacteria bacterium ACD]|nr:aminotransferase class I/II-fold pyridoxal phosphate-dependent enzyme [Acidobacteria bacterium ACD]
MSAARPLRVERPEVLRGLPASGHAVVEASAGTGKTHTIESLVVELLLVRGLPVESLLVVTFTEKAAAELTRRIRDRLRGLSRREVPEAPASRDARDCWHVGEEERRRLRRALASYGNASISTIHAFCRGVLGEYAFAGGQLLSLETVPEEAALRRAVLDVARGRLATDPALSPWLEAWFASSPAPRDGTRLDGLVTLLCGLRRVRGEPYPVLDRPALAEAVRSFPPPPASEAALRATLGAGGLRDRSIDAVLDPLLRICERVDEVRHDAHAPDLYLRLAGDGELSQDLAVVFSKAFGMAGYRCGYTAGPKAAMTEVRKLHTHNVYSANTVAQLAAARALSGPGDAWAAKARASYRETGRKAAGRLGVPPPEGSTFLFLDVAEALEGRDLGAFLSDCADQGLFLAPGQSFGPYPTHVRLCYTAAPPDVTLRGVEVLARLLGR